MASINDNNRWKEKIMKDKKKFAKKTIIPITRCVRKKLHMST